MTMLLWGFVIVALYAVILLWMLRRRRRMTANLDRAAADRQAVSDTMRWSTFAGIFCCRTVFLPMMFGQIGTELAMRPPARQ